MTSYAVRAVPHAEFTRVVHAAGLPVPVEQSEPWARVEQSNPGREPWRTLLVEAAGVPVAALALVRYTGRAMTQQWAKHGPVWLQGSPTPDQERALRTAVARYVRREDPAAAVLRLHATDADGCRPPLVATQWDRTVVLDIGRSDDDIMASMSKSGRRDLRYGIKNDEIQITDETDISATGFATTIYPVFAETAERAGFGLMGAANYYAILRELRPDHARLYAARKDGQVVCWGLFTLVDGAATYYFAASSQAARNTFAVYKVLWHAIGELRALGATSLDFYGVSSPRCPELASLDDFKLKWTRGESVARPGSWDVVLRPSVVRLYDAQQTGRRWARRAVAGLRAGLAQAGALPQRLRRATGADTRASSPAE